MNRLNLKDLINAGMFSVLILVTVFISGMIGFIPVTMPLIPFIVSLVSGSIYMLYTTKIKKFGMVLIMGILFSILFTASGHGVFAAPGILIASLLAEMVLKKGGYSSLKYSRLSYVVFSLYDAALVLPIYLSRDAYANKLIEQGYGKEYTEKLLGVMPSWSFLPVAIGGMIGAYIGCTIGIKILKKHFIKAGLV